MARAITELPNLATEGGRVAPVRARMPIYLDRLPPCNNTCPAGENIQEWLSLVKAGSEEGAWRELVKNNPFPAIHGRVCCHPSPPPRWRHRPGWPTSPRTCSPERTW